MSNKGELENIHFRNHSTTAQQRTSLHGRIFGPAPSSAMAFSVDREGGDTDMTHANTMHPLPHPSRRARKRGSKSENQKNFENNYFMKEYE